MEIAEAIAPAVPGVGTRTSGEEACIHDLTGKSTEKWGEYG